MTPRFHFEWSHDSYLQQYTSLLYGAETRSLARLTESSDFADSVYLTAGYSSVVRHTLGFGAPEDYDRSFSWIEGKVMLHLIFPLRRVYLEHTLAIEALCIEWVFDDGNRVVVPTILVTDGSAVLVCCADEFTLHDDFAIDRELFRAALRHTVDSEVEL